MPLTQRLRYEAPFEKVRKGSFFNVCAGIGFTSGGIFVGFALLHHLGAA